VRVLIDTTYARRAPLSGTATYLDRITAALAALPDVDIITTANDARRQSAGGGAASLANAAADLRWIQRELPHRARAARADVIHHALPARSYGTSVAQVITVHDLAFERRPELFAPAFRRYAHLDHRAAARRADAVICVSQTTAADVRELWRVQEGRIVVARHGPGQELPPRPRLSRPTHLLYIGDPEPRKDLATLLEAHRRYSRAARDPLPLVLAGSVAPQRSDVIVESCPSPARLAELLAGAVALVHPALYEGFGLTLLEAMRAGAPVVAAAAPGTTEVCADAARYFSPGDPQGLAETIAELAANPALQVRLAELGRIRAAAFSWDVAARGHLDAYSLALR
jgi:glycosyltransferase involved in cell wall biosynthesis